MVGLICYHSIPVQFKGVHLFCHRYAVNLLVSTFPNVQHSHCYHCLIISLQWPALLTSSFAICLLCIKTLVWHIVKHLSLRWFMGEHHTVWESRSTIHITYLLDLNSCMQTFLMYWLHVSSLMSRDLTKEICPLLHSLELHTCIIVIFFKIKCLLSWLIISDKRAFWVAYTRLWTGGKWKPVLFCVFINQASSEFMWVLSIIFQI